MPPRIEPDITWAGAPPRIWQRVSVRLAAVFALVTLLAVGAVGASTYQRYRREVQDTVGTQLLNIARITALAVDPALHASARASLDAGSAEYRALQQRLVAIQNEVLLTTPISTLVDVDAGSRRARRIVVSDGPGRPGDSLALAPEVVDPLRWTMEDGVARYTGLYENERGRWITAFAPIVAAGGRPVAIVAVDYPVEIYRDRLDELRATLVSATVIGAMLSLIAGLVFAQTLTRPVRALTSGVARVAGGDLSQPLPVRSADELGRLTRAFNHMLDGLRQREFIRAAFGRYVSPEVARELLDSPEGLRFGGEKRIVTVLMSDLRGYTQFSERGDPAHVMDVLNEYLARMTDVIIAHGGTINEFIGDAVFAVFGAPLAHADHAERAAGAALGMQRAMAEINRQHAASGLPRFEMGIGINTGEAVVGNVGSEQRAKYTVVGSAVNVAARVEGATVGGQVFVTASTYEAIRDVALVDPPVLAQMKGLTEPVALYELRGLSGRFAQMATPAERDADVAVALPITCWRIDGKVVAADALVGATVRIGRRGALIRLGAPLPPLTNVRLHVQYPGGDVSGDIYGKVRTQPAGATSGSVPGPDDRSALTPIHFTSLTDEDAAALERLVAGAVGVAAIGSQT